MKVGTSTGTVYTSPKRKQARARRRKREEQRWAAKAGPITVTYREILPTTHEILPNGVSREEANVPAALVEPQRAADGPDPVGHRQDRAPGRA